MEGYKSMFGEKLLRRIFGPGREEVTGDWKKFNKKKSEFLPFTKYY
jgi:hypothetical protein